MYTTSMLLGALLLALGTTLSHRRTTPRLVRVNQFSMAMVRGDATVPSWISLLMLAGIMTVAVSIVGTSIAASV